MVCCKARAGPSLNVSGMPVSSGTEASYSLNARKGELGQQGYTVLGPDLVTGS